MDFSHRIKDLENQIEDIGSQLAENFHATVQMLATITLSSEKYYDGSHSRYVAQKSVALAERLGFTGSDLYVLETAGLLHDIGKLGFSDSILIKYQAELQGEEFRIYSRHPEIAVRIIGKHSGFDEIAEIILQHHEKIDGTGFPRKLQGSAIHPSAAIIAVVDNFHSLVYKRKREKSPIVSIGTKVSSASQFLSATKDRTLSALNFLKTRSGSYFSPKILDVFFQMIEEERRNLGEKTVTRAPIGQLTPGMVIAEDYYTTYGLLIAAQGENITEASLSALVRFAENGEIPMKLLVMK